MLSPRPQLSGMKKQWQAAGVGLQSPFLNYGFISVTTWDSLGLERDGEALLPLRGCTHLLEPSLLKFLPTLSIQ